MVCRCQNEAEDIWTAIWHEEAHHSTAIEGNTLVMHEVEALLSEGRVVGKKQLRDYMEVSGYADAAKWVYSQAVAPGDWAPEGALLSPLVFTTSSYALPQ